MRCDAIWANWPFPFLQGITSEVSALNVRARYVVGLPVERHILLEFQVHCQGLFAELITKSFEIDVFSLQLTGTTKKVSRDGIAAAIDFFAVNQPVHPKQVIEAA